MEGFLAGMFITLAIIGLVAFLYLFFLRKTAQPTETDDVHAGQEGPTTEAAPSRAPKSLNAFWADWQPGEDRRAQWKAGVDRDRAVEEPEYRVQAGSPSDERPRWNPFDPKAGRAARAHAARRRPRRIHRGGKREFYTLLGVEPDASDQQIERAYRQRASEIHPDLFYDDPARKHEAEARLKELNAAMQVLRDPLRRARYNSSR